MKIFFLGILLILFITFFVKKIFNSAKRNLLKDQAAWSGKDIKIKYIKDKKAEEPIDSNKDKNILKMIADESQNFLEEESNKIDSSNP